MLEKDLGPTIKPSDIDAVLTATRTGAVLGKLSLSDNDFIEPESLQRGLYPHWGILRRRGTREVFLLTERPFSRTVNSFFGSLPSKLIEFYINQSRKDQVRVLDAGGGRDATAAREIAARYPTVEVTNVDMVAINERSGNFTSQRGDLCNLDILDESIDFAYSHQVLPYTSRRDNFGRHIQVIHEIFRVLKPGGTGVIDFTDDSSLVGYVLSGVDRGWNGRILPKQKSYGGVFLLVAKNPVDTAVIKIGETAPDLAV